MADDWIKMRSNLATHPKVLRMASMIFDCPEAGRRLSPGHNGPLRDIVTHDVTRDVTLASLLRVWGAANDHTDDGIWRGMRPNDLDHIAGVPGFGAAMESVGWARYDETTDATIFPNFLEYNAPAKNGARRPAPTAAAERQRKYRARKRNGVTQNVTSPVAQRDVTRDVTVAPREEKKREDLEEKNTQSAKQKNLLDEIDEPAGPEPELLAAIEWWNSMAAAKLVSHRVVDPMGKGVQSAWKAFQRDRHRQEWLSDRAAVRSKIEQSPICREGWFRFEKLFSGNNPQSIPIAQLVSEGAYVKSATKPQSIGGDAGKCYPGDSWT